MRISVTVELFLDPEILQNTKMHRNQAMNVVSSAIEDAVEGLGKIVSSSMVTTQVTKEGPSAAN